MFLSLRKWWRKKTGKWRTSCPDCGSKEQVTKEEFAYRKTYRDGRRPDYVFVVWKNCSDCNFSFHRGQEIRRKTSQGLEQLI